MALCDYCGKHLNYIPFKCRRCGLSLCKKCRLPEYHNCPGLIHPKPGGGIFEPFTSPSPRKHPPKKHPPRTHHHKRHIKNKRLKIALSVSLVLVVLFILFGSISKFTIEEVDRTKIEKVNKTIPNIVSFGKFINDPYKYEGTNITLKGYLMRYIEGTEMAGVFVESIKDDMGNRIDFSNMPRNYVGLFPRTGETEEIYEVKGVFVRDYKKILLDVKEIKESQRDIAEIKEVDEEITFKESVITRNSTRVLFLVSDLFSKLIDDIGEKTSELELEDKSEEVKESIEDITDKAQGIVMKVADTSLRDIKDKIEEELDDMLKPINETEIEDRIFILVNEERARNGRRPLVRNSYLDKRAKAHSDKMINGDFFVHSKDNLGENIALTPIHSSVIGCGSTYRSESQAQCFVSGWISSPGHHTNMIMYSYVSTGIGVACSSYECKATQNFR